MVIAAALVLQLGRAARADDAESTPARLHHYYGTAKGYAEVTHDVMQWHKTALNGCVAFASTALRHIGLDIPLDATIDGYKVSRITGAFSRYLSETLGWTRIDSVDELEPGDIVFSTDASCCAGYPNHVMMFDGWSKRDQEIAIVVDNQGFRVARPFAPREGSDIDPFHYALRPPPVADH